MLWTSLVQPPNFAIKKCKTSRAETLRHCHTRCSWSWFPAEVVFVVSLFALFLKNNNNNNLCLFTLHGKSIISILYFLVGFSSSLGIILHLKGLYSLMNNEKVSRKFFHCSPAPIPFSSPNPHMWRGCEPGQPVTAGFVGTFLFLASKSHIPQ